MKYIEKLDYLDEYLDDFIDRVSRFKRVYNEETQMEEYKQTIWLKSIISSPLKEEEYEYVFEYLKQRKITVDGHSYALCGYFDNYKYYPYHLKKDYCSEVEKIEDMDEEISKYKNMPEGLEKTELRDNIIRNNISLVHFFSNKYSKITKIDSDELFGYGCIGLINALDSFVVNDNNKFSTFASNSIIGYILKSIPEILGFSDRNLYYEMLKVKKELDTDDIENIASELAKDRVLISKEDRIHQLNIYNPLSIEEMDFSDHNMQIGEVLDSIFSLQAQQELLDEIGEYDPYGILEKSFGLNDNSSKNDQQVAEELGVSRQHINKTKKKLLKKMGNSDRLKELNRESFY